MFASIYRVLMITLGVVVITLSSHSLVLPSLCFKIDQARIAAEECEKKEVKMNDCQGMCQLRDVIKEAEDRKSKSSHFFQNLSELWALSVSEHETDFFVQTKIIQEIMISLDEPQWSPQVKKPPPKV